MIYSAASSGTTRTTLVNLCISILTWVHKLLTYNTAIWDNRSTYHAATYDYDGMGLRTGQRCVGIGERPYFDPASKSKREAEGEEYLEPGEGFTVF